MTVVDEINTKNALRITNAWLSEVQYEAPYFGCGDMEAIKKALEKQIPKKPIKNNPIINNFWSEDSMLCPICHQYVGTLFKDVYCSYCGQRLKKEGGTSD